MGLHLLPAPPHCPGGAQAILSVGVLTTPIPRRSPHLRTLHRSAHAAFVLELRDSICVRYLLGVAEVAALDGPAHSVVSAEARQHGDILVLPPAVVGQVVSSGPPGAGCVLKIISWLQYATARLRAFPFVAFADDDTLMLLPRFVSITRLLAARIEARARAMVVACALTPCSTTLILAPTLTQARAVSVYAGAMQYHTRFDLSQMQPTGWHATLSDASADFLAQQRDGKLEDALAGKQRGGAHEGNRNVSFTAPNGSALSAHPYLMAHGLCVLLSLHLADTLPASPFVAEFLERYAKWARARDSPSVPTAPNSPGTPPHRDPSRGKCFLGTDSTFGFWVSACRA